MLLYMGVTMEIVSELSGLLSIKLPKSTKGRLFKGGLARRWKGFQKKFS
jgi:hypothetical protein